jgi:RNA polymerase sigma factor (TIGR02999 family)
LQATALVHEAWIKLCTGKTTDWEDNNHFLNSVMRTMRCVLIDEIRRGNRLKRGGSWTAIPLQSNLIADPEILGRTLDVEDALKELSKLSEDVAQVVELRFFTGFDDEEISSALDMNAARVRTAWRMARAWLRIRLDGSAA